MPEDRVEGKVLAEHFKKHGVVHLIWLIVLLIAAIIGLSSVKLGTDDSVKDILNFAVALSSMLLALVAIVQAIVSSGSMGDTISQVHGALASIAGPAERLDKAADVLSQYSQNLDQKTRQLDTSINEFTARWMPSKEPTDAQAETFTEKMLEHADLTTKVSLYILVSSYEAQRPYRYFIPEDAGTFEFFIRGYINALVDGFVIGTKSYDGFLQVYDLGDLNWLTKKKHALINADGDNQRKLTAMIAEVDKAGADLERSL